MILKKVNNIFVLDDIPEDALNIKMFQTVEYYINFILDTAGYIYVKNILLLFNVFDEDFSFEIDDSISDDDRIYSCNVYFDVYCKEDFIFANDRQRYKIVFQTVTKGECDKYDIEKS